MIIGRGKIDHLIQTVWNSSSISEDVNGVLYILLEYLNYKNVHKQCIRSLSCAEGRLRITAQNNHHEYEGSN